jgi:hypothetical protein
LRIATANVIVLRCVTAQVSAHAAGRGIVTGLGGVTFVVSALHIPHAETHALLAF